MIRVLFVCMGNICRSPMAEAVFVHLVREAGLEAKIEADSAGTGDWHVGQPPHHGTRRMLERNNIAYNGCARQLTSRDLDDFDYIITMDEQNLRDVNSLQVSRLHRRQGEKRVNVARLLDYAPDTHTREVPDPYFTDGFEGVYALVWEGASGLLAAIQHEHGL
jgi:protein-tyrosine phosphatase